MAALCAHAQLTIPGADGSDGVFAPTASTNINLALAPTGTWDGANASPGRGVYDPAKWAVVLRYSSVNIPAGVTVTFSNHPTQAPVVWLVSGNATIGGTVSLNGIVTSGTAVQSPGGPGGFRGSYVNGAGGSGRSGFGPGGGALNDNGTYATAYGNARLLPLLGGSGAGYHSGNGAHGGGGGGAILIAVSGNLAVNGIVRANGAYHANGHVGSGGALRLIAGNMMGTGVLQAVSNSEIDIGRIRLEAANYTGALGCNPQAAVVPPDNPVLIWPQTDAPSVRVVSIGGISAPTDPTSSLNPPGGDVNFSVSNAVQVVIEARNLATNATMRVRITHTIQNSADTVTAGYVSGDFTLSQWAAMATIAPNTYAAIQVRAVGP
jgi:hypothetical protein